jgi:hypothetical protein
MLCLGSEQHAPGIILSLDHFLRYICFAIVEFLHPLYLKVWVKLDFIRLEVTVIAFTQLQRDLEV